MVISWLESTSVLVARRFAGLGAGIAEGRRGGELADHLSGVEGVVAGVPGAEVFLAVRARHVQRGQGLRMPAPRLLRKHGEGADVRWHRLVMQGVVHWAASIRRHSQLMSSGDRRRGYRRLKFS